MALKETEKIQLKKQIKPKFTRNLLRQCFFCYGSPGPPYTINLIFFRWPLQVFRHRILANFHNKFFHCMVHLCSSLKDKTKYIKVPGSQEASFVII